MQLLVCYIVMVIRLILMMMIKIVILIERRTRKIDSEFKQFTKIEHLLNYSTQDANPTSTETEEGQTAKRASSDKNSSKEQEIRNDAGAKGPNSACASAQKGPESNSESCRLSRRSASSSSVNSLSVSHQRRLSLGVAMQDSSLQYASKDVVTTKTTEDDINILTSTNSDPMGMTFVFDTLNEIDVTDFENKYEFE